MAYRYDNESGNYYDERGQQVDPRIAEAQASAAGSQAAQGLVGLSPYTGRTTQGLRGPGTGENSHWGYDEAGREWPLLTIRNGSGAGQSYLLPDLMKKYGSLKAIAALGRDPNADMGDGTNSEAGKGWFETSLGNFGARPSNDFLSGKDGLRDGATIALMATAAFTGGFGLGGAEGGAAAGGTTAGDAAIGGGAGVDALSSGAAATGLTDIGGGFAVDEAGNVVASGAASGGAGGAAGAGAFDLGSGMSVDAYGNVIGAGAGAGTAAATGGAAAGGILGNPQLLGAAAGALLGGAGANSKPAGETTSTSDVPAWLMPYVQGNLNAATGTRDALLASPNAADAAMPEYLKTIRGDYLDPATNPYLDATFKHSAGLVGANVDSRFEAAGRYGSGAHQGVLQEGFDNLANSIYGGNYQAERARQAAAVTGAPAFDTGTATAAYAPFSGYASLFPGSKSTTTPYFTNQAGGILGGALAGSQIARMFG